MLSVIDDISLMVINKVDKIIGRELENHRVRILQKLCLQRLYKERQIQKIWLLIQMEEKFLVVMRLNPFKIKNGSS